MATKKKEKEIKGEERLENVESALSKTELWIEKNQKFIYGIIAAVVIIAGGIWGYRAWVEKKNSEASTEIYKAEYYFNKGMYEEALVGDGNYLGFTELYDSYSKTKTGKLAAYYAGICYKQMGKNEEAIDYLKKFNGKDEIFAPMALGVIGDCYMDLDNVEEAAAYYMKAANKSKNEFTGPLFLNKAALTYEILGEYKSALKCYQALKEDYPLSTEAYEVGKSISKMEELLK